MATPSSKSKRGPTLMVTPSSKSKRGRPSDNTPPEKSKKNKDNPTQVCPICEENIIESDKSVSGEDAIFCEGECRVWLHRKCVGLTKKAYTVIGNSEEPYLCPYCSSNYYRKEINELKKLVKSLSEKLSLVDDLTKSVPGLPESTVSDQTSSLLSNRKSNQQPIRSTQNAHHQQPSLGLKNRFSRNSYGETDRRFNVVVYGIEESSSNLSRINRFQSELEKIISALPKVNQTSIKDFHRLGKFKVAQEHPRPIIVKFLRVLDATAVLSDRNDIPSPISVKPDMSPEERSIESKLLKERYKLIQQGIPRKSIRIRNTHLYVNNQLYGQVKDSVLQLVSTTGQPNSTQSTSDSPMSDSVSPLLNPGLSHSNTNPTQA